MVAWFFQALASTANGPTQKTPFRGHRSGGPAEPVGGYDTTGLAPRLSSSSLAALSPRKSSDEWVLVDDEPLSLGPPAEAKKNPLADEPEAGASASPAPVGAAAEGDDTG